MNRNSTDKNKKIRKETRLYIPAADGLSCWQFLTRSSMDDIHAAYAHSVTAALHVETLNFGRCIRFNHQQRQIVKR